MIEVESRVLGARRGDGLGSVFFDPGSERLTVRTIILRAVEEQVRDINARRELSMQEAVRQLARQYQTEDEIRALREEPGRSSFPASQRPRRKIELSKVQTNALDAFTAGRCLVFVGDRQMEALDQEVDVRADTKIQFLRVLPLRGGC